MSSTDRPYRNTYWVLPGRLLAGEYPAAENPDESRERLGRFLSCGIDCFLDLTEEDEIPSYCWLLGKLACQRRLEVAYHRIPIRDLRIPGTPEQMVEILRQIDDWLSAGRRVYVHCRGGVGRTGMVIGCWLVRNGLPGDQALERLQDLWSFVSEVKRSCFPRSPQNLEQQDYIRTWYTHDPGNPRRPR